MHQYIRITGALILGLYGQTALAQQNWNRLPQFPSACYSSQDDYISRVQTLRETIHQEAEREDDRVKSKFGSMTEAEKQKMAVEMMTRYQRMTPQEIVDMQQEQTDMAARSSQFTSAETDILAKFNELESRYRTDIGEQLGPLWQEYQKLPDGEGTPDWAIKKGKELDEQYNQRYQEICKKYFSGPQALFVLWLGEYKNFLVNTELPFSKQQQASQWKQTGLPAVETNSAELNMVKKYADKCLEVFRLRRSTPGLGV